MNSESYIPLEAGRRIAALAASVCVSAQPEERLKAPDGNPWQWIDDERVAKYRKLGEEVKRLSSYHNKAPQDRYDNWAWGSCHQAVAIIIRACVDKDMPMDRPEVCPGYMQKHPASWMHVGSVECIDDELLQPGDILNVVEPRTHTCIFLGHEIARLYHPQTQGVIWEASYTSERALYPGITDKGLDGKLDVKYEVYRYVGKPCGALDISPFL